jgi:hypothetical protein
VGHAASCQSLCQVGSCAGNRNGLHSSWLSGCRDAARQAVGACGGADVLACCCWSLLRRAVPLPAAYTSSDCTFTARQTDGQPRHCCGRCLAVLWRSHCIGCCLCWPGSSEAPLACPQPAQHCIVDGYGRCLHGGLGVLGLLDGCGCSHGLDDVACQHTCGITSTARQSTSCQRHSTVCGFLRASSAVLKRHAKQLPCCITLELCRSVGLRAP